MEIFNPWRYSSPVPVSTEKKMTVTAFGLEATRREIITSHQV
jgi:hypothetical protein